MQTLFTNRLVKELFFSALILLSCSARAQYPIFDLAIEHANIFDSRTKKIHKNKTILICSDTISVIVSSARKFRATQSINAKKRLVVPGFIDTHTHLRNVYGTIENVESDKLSLDRKMLSNCYLKYGTTTLLDMGQPEKWVDTSFAWQNNPSPEYPNIFISGGAIVTEEEGRKTYMNHVAVKNPEEAALKVKSYSAKGIKHIKIYWRLQRPEMEAVVAEAQKKDMTVSAHIDNNITTISDAMDLGVKNFEHILSLPPAVLILNEHYDQMKELYGYGSVDNSDKFLAQILFFFDYIKSNPELNARLESLFDKMVTNKVSLSTAVHIMGSVAEETYFFTSLSLNSDSLDLSSYTAVQKNKLRTSFHVMMHYLKNAHQKGVKIRIGTDCKDGGKALLSELLLLYEAKFSVEDILQIATWNGAVAMKIDDKYGSIEVGKKADLLIFSESPFDNYKNFLSEKIIVKSGKIFTLK